MADAASDITQTTNLAGTNMLHDIVKGQAGGFAGADQDWGEFYEKFLLKLLRAVRLNKDTVVFGQNEYELERVLEVFAEYLADDRFRELLYTWSRVKNPSLTLEEIVEVTEELSHLDFSTQNIGPLEEVRDSLKELFSPEAAEEPTDEEKAEEAFRQRFTVNKEPILSLQNEDRPAYGKVRESFDDTKLEIEEQFSGALAEKEGDEKRQLELQVDKAKDEQEKEFTKKLEELWKKTFEEAWKGQYSALKESLFEVLEEENLSAQEFADELVEAFVDATLFNILTAEVVFDEFRLELKTSLEELTKKYEELKKEYQDKLNAALSLILGLVLKPDALTPETGGGEGEEEGTALGGAKEAAVTALSSRLDTLFASLARISAEDKPTVLGRLESLAKSRLILAPATSVVDLNALEQLLQNEIIEQFEVLPDDEGGITLLAEQFTAFLDALQQEITGFLPKPGEEPTASLPFSPLDTALPTEAATTAAQDQRLALRQLQSTQQQLVLNGLEEMRRILETNKNLSKSQIEVLLKNNRETLAQEIWLELLQRGGLTEKLEFADIAKIWMGVVETNAHRILIEQNLSATPLQRAAEMSGVNATEAERTLKNLLSGYDITSAQVTQIFENLNQEKFAQLIAFAQKQNGLSSEQRVATLQSILGKKFLETDARAVAGILDTDNFLAFVKKFSPNIDPKLGNRLTQLGNKEALTPAEEQELLGILMAIRQRSGIPDQAWQQYFAQTDSQELLEIYGKLRKQQTALDQLQVMAPNVALTPHGLSSLPRLGPEPSQQEVEVHVRESFMLEVSLALSFQVQQEGGVAVLLHQYRDDPAMLARIAAGMEAGGAPPQGLPETPAGIAGMQQQRFGAQASAQQQSFANRQASTAASLRVAMKLMATGGNPALMAKQLLTDGETREVFFQQMKKAMPYMLAGQGVALSPVLIALANIGNFVSAVTGFLPSLVGGIGSFIGGFFGGGSPSAQAGVSGAFNAAMYEGGAKAGTAAKVGASQITPAAQGQVASAINSTYSSLNTFLTGTVTASTPAGLVTMTVIGPLLFMVTMTFIVFSVIGGTLNDLPTGNTLESALSYEFGLLNTTDMACISVDQTSFSSQGGSQYIETAQELAVLAMRDPDARKICNVANKIVFVYGADSFGGWGHYDGLQPNGHAVRLGENVMRSNAVGVWTVFHEFGHVLQYSSNIQGVHDQAMGSALVSSYDYETNCYPYGCAPSTESAAEGVALFLMLPALPPYSDDARNVDIRTTYPSLFNALIGFFATL